MTPELTALALAALLQSCQLGINAIAVVRSSSVADALGPRDQGLTRDAFAGRVKRAMDNHFEALILFSIAVLITLSSGQASSFTAGCAWAYLGARIAYIPAYIFGWTPGRTLIWFVGFFATLAMILASLI